MITPIKDKKQYLQYLDRAYQLMQKDLQPNSKLSDEMELLSILIEKYERDNHPIDPPNPIDAILFRIDQLGMDKVELSKVLGSRSRVSEILNGKRKLSLNMIRNLNKKLGISAQTLINDYEISH